MLHNPKMPHRMHHLPPHHTHTHTHFPELLLTTGSLAHSFLTTLGSGLAAKTCLTLVTPWTVACQAPLSMGFSRQESWSGLSFTSPGDLPSLRIKPGSPALQADSLLTELLPLLSPHYFLKRQEHSHSGHHISSLGSVSSPRKLYGSFSLFSHLFSKNHLYKRDFPKSYSPHACKSLLPCSVHRPPQEKLSPPNTLTHNILFLIYPIPQVCNCLEDRDYFCLLNISSTWSIIGIKYIFVVWINE